MDHLYDTDALIRNDNVHELHDQYVDHAQETNLNTRRKMLNIGMVTFAIPFIIANITILALFYNKICHPSIIAWFYVRIGYDIGVIFLTIYSRIVRTSTIVGSKFYSLSILLFNIGTIVWGIVILCDGDACRDQVPSVYSMILANVLVYGILLSMIILCTCCCFCILLCGIFLFPDSFLNNDGADPESIQSIPSFEYVPNEQIVIGSSQHFISEVDAICAICLVPYLSGTKCRWLNCNHHFCSECLDRWLVTSNTCPCCRSQACHKPDHVQDKV